MDLQKRVGTNFYTNLGSMEDPNLIHIGKLAHGIRFVIRSNPEHYTDFEMYSQFIRKYPIYNHLGNRVDSEYFLSLIPGNPETNSILPVLKEAGKENFVSIMKQYNKKGKLVAEYDCVDMDFHKDMTGIKLKNSVK